MHLLCSTQRVVCPVMSRRATRHDLDGTAYLVTALGNTRIFWSCLKKRQILKCLSCLSRTVLRFYWLLTSLKYYHPVSSNVVILMNHQTLSLNINTDMMGIFFVKSFMKNCKKIYQFKSWNVSFPLALELECNKRNSRIQCTCSCDDTWRVYNVSNVSYRWAIFQLKSVLWKLNL